ncbi:hypothetical protein E2C01_095327 [Portunus trituberculatus]|uniref:Uncharacterized protein n=1 Tax=Portunus trituberculatus TaxID=210409 RepID=A0A5B7JUY9_PORTR|nr:hypothetical protein [Portunus trituberculatus]
MGPAPGSLVWLTAAPATGVSSLAVCQECPAPRFAGWRLESCGGVLYNLVVGMMVSAGTD